MSPGPHATPSLARSALPRGSAPALDGRRLAVRFVERLREERRFSGPAELARQIALDCVAARRVPGVEPIPLSSQTCLVKSPIR